MEAIRGQSGPAAAEFSFTFAYRDEIKDHSSGRSHKPARASVMTKSVTIDEIPDELLLQRIAARDVQAVDAFYERYAQKVFNLLVRIVTDSRVAEELLQETFLQVWQKGGSYQGEGAVPAWLFRIARNKGLDHLRRRKARPQAADDSQDGDELLERISATGPIHVEKQVSLNLDQARLREALAAVPEEQRQCLELAYFQGMSQSEIAEFTQTSLGTVKTRIRLGLEKLERSLRAAGIREVDAS